MWVLCCLYRYLYYIINSYNASSYNTEDQTHTHTEAHKKKQNKDETSHIVNQIYKSHTVIGFVLSMLNQYIQDFDIEIRMGAV